MGAENSLILDFALRSANVEKKNGNLHVLASTSGTARELKNAILVINTGELIGCNFAKRTGVEAINLLLQFIALRAIFFNRDTSGIVAQKGIPSIRDILKELHASQSGESPEHQTTEQPIQIGDLSAAKKLGLATDILASVIGEEEARNQIRTIVKLHSLDEDFAGFIQACIALAASYVGEHIARQMFDEIA